MSSDEAAGPVVDYDLSEIQVRFITKLPNAVPDNQFAVPVRLTRYGLSGIINHLLAQDPPKPYDFLIEQKFLRTSLQKYLTSNGISQETVLVIEYVEALPEPETVSAQPHPDWVSTVDGSCSKYILSGSYDGRVRIWPGRAYEAEGDQKHGDHPLCTVSGHLGAVKSVKWLRLGAKPLEEEDELYFVSASKDRTLSISKFSPETGEAAPLVVCAGHTDGVDCVASAPRSHMIASGGWDQKILIWDFFPEQAKRAKKHKGANGKQTASQQSASRTLEGHTDAVTALAWPDILALYSGSQDHSIKEWDVQESRCRNSWHCKQVVTGLDFSLNCNLLASSHHDRSVRIWDPRTQDGEVVKMTLTSHRAWVSGVAWSPTDANLLASSSYDGTVKLWDLRSNIPLHTINAHKDKALCIDWHTNGETINLEDAADASVRAAHLCLISGGSDRQLQTHKVSHHSE